MKVYNLENIKSATELKHRTEVISMNERSIIVLDNFLLGIAQKAASCFYFFIPSRYRKGYESIAGFRE